MNEIAYFTNVCRVCASIFEDIDDPYVGCDNACRRCKPFASWCGDHPDWVSVLERIERDCDAAGLGVYSYMLSRDPGGLL